MTRSASRFAPAAIAAIAAAFTAIAWASPAGGLTPEHVEEMLQAHGAWRRNVGVAPLRWSTDLARRAQAHADGLAAGGCRLSHDGLPRSTGENLFASTYASRVREDDVRRMGPAEVVNLWAAEGADYDYARNRCAQGKRCGHYTQIVARKSKEVGCGMAVCPSRGQVWVCDYRPAGNVEGQRPY
jgi:pathogenesis-related protein 1